MHRALVTGATGTVGNLVARRLLADGIQVRALVRAPGRAAALLPAAVELAAGDVTDEASVRQAVAGCDTVFHVAGLPEQWLSDPGAFERVNLGGTRHLVAASLAEGVRCFVHTSTIDALERSPGVPFDESRLASGRLGTAYQRSKLAADEHVTEAVLRDGLPARIVHPSAVYGPGTVGTTLNQVLLKLLRNQVPALPPGGLPVVYAPDVAEGHLLAAAAPVGSRYILSDQYLTLRRIAELVAAAAPGAKVPPTMPAPVAKALAALGESAARLLRRPPLLASGELHFLLSHPLPDATRARTELGWTTTPPAEAVPRTVQALLA
ncbi:SDR family NAD(P)-dependent oxidoreductase [Kitasatospora sp. NPDC049285]|uniref:SDR family NAD(P)-dependent oxidoreductase n=1 Tax=Kitasatospora sp. NPDC049285 TaxID=3157096 RepID=UPI00342846EA